MINWQTGVPKHSSAWYLVALLYKNNMGGTIGCATWDGENGWSVDQEYEEVIGHIPVRDLIKETSITWPEHLVPTSNKD